MEWEHLKWFGVIEFGWSLEESGALKWVDLVEYLDVKDGLVKAGAFNARRRPSSM